MRLRYYLLGLLLLAALFLYYFGSTPQDSYKVTADGMVHYPQFRGPANYTRSLVSTDNDGSLYKIVFQSQGTPVYALLRLPNKPVNSNAGFAGIVLLPGALVPKENEDLSLGRELASLGFAVLIPDVRGVGETGGTLPSLDDDFAAFQSGKQPTQHLMVYDSLRAFDVLAAQPEVNSSRILFAGESNGGRVAIIAAALEKRALGAIGISTGGYDVPADYSPDAARFANSANPDSYAPLVAPRKIVLIHSRSDAAVPYSAARKTYGLSREPRLLLSVDCAKHGYCSEMNPSLEIALEFISGPLAPLKPAKSPLESLPI